MDRLLRWLLGEAAEPREEHTVQQDPDKARHRALQDRLIDEQRQANERDRSRISATAPALQSRYINTMNQAMAILRGEDDAL